MKRVLSIQDLSCVGKCSLTAALPVLSAMGCACSVLPTAVLSTHTGFPGPRSVSLTGSLADFAAHWKSQGITFHGISVGYLADPAQAQVVEDILDTFGKFVVLDPVMGDNGRLYTGITPDHCQALTHLCPLADVLLPNVTEAAALTGVPYCQTGDPGYLRELAQELMALGPRAVLITGVMWNREETGFWGVSQELGEFTFRNSYIPRQLHGTGDLFTAVLLGGMMRGLALPQAGALAADFVRQTVVQTPHATPFGAAFEPLLPYLWEQLNALLKR